MIGSHNISSDPVGSHDAELLHQRRPPIQPARLHPPEMADSDLAIALALVEEIAAQRALLTAPQAAVVAGARAALEALCARTETVVAIVGDRATAGALELLTGAGLFEPDMTLAPVVELRTGQAPRVQVELRNGVRRAIHADPSAELALHADGPPSWWSRARRTCKRGWRWLRTRIPRTAPMRQLPERSEFADRVRRLALRVPAEPTVVRVCIESPAMALSDTAVVDLRGPGSRTGRWSDAAVCEAGRAEVCLLVVDGWTPEVVELVTSLARSRLWVVGPYWQREVAGVELVYLDGIPQGDELARMVEHEVQLHRTAGALAAVRAAKACLADAVDRARARDHRVLAKADAAVAKTTRSMAQTARAALGRKLVAAGARAVEEVLAQLPGLVATQKREGLCAVDETATRGELQLAMLGLSESLRRAAERVGSVVAHNVETIGQQVLIDSLATVGAEVERLQKIVGGDAAPMLARACTPLRIEAAGKLAMRASFQVSLAHMTPASSWIHSFDSIRARCRTAVDDAYEHLLSGGRAEALDAEPEVRAQLARVLEARLSQLDEVLDAWVRDRLERERIRRRRALEPAARLCHVAAQSFEDKLEYALDRRLCCAP